MKYHIYHLNLVLLMANPVLYSQSTLDGVYQLHGKMEMAAAFKFNSDGTFEFYYSYGAVDRQAQGTYKLNGDKIQLQSDKIPGQDFHVINESAAQNPQIKVVAPESWMIRDVVCRIISGKQEEYIQTDETGIAYSTFPVCDIIMVVHALFPDEWTVIKSAENQNQYFEIGLNPSLANVSFAGVEPVLTAEELVLEMEYFFGKGEVRFKQLK